MRQKSQAVVIGLGQFGMAVARSLNERGVEVLAVDRREDKVREAAAWVTDAACFDATGIEALSRTSPAEREVCVCAIGDESKESSIICTALLKQMGARRIVARANDDVHARILHLVGAHTVVNPEREYGERFATRVMHGGVVGELALGGNLLLTEFTIPASFVGHSLIELRLPNRFGLTVVAIRSVSTNTVSSPVPARPLAEGEVLLVVSGSGALDKLMERS